MLLCYHCFTGYLITSLNKTELSKKYPKKVVPHWSAQTESGLHWFKTSFQLQIPIALYQIRRNGVIEEEEYQTRRNGVIGEARYQINNPIKPYIFLYKHWTARKVGNSVTFTIGLPTRTMFDDRMAKKVQDRFVSIILLYQRY